MALSFREQTDLIREGTDSLLAGHSREAFEKNLYERGLYKADVDKLGFEIDRALGERFEQDIQAQLEATGTATNTFALSEDAYVGLLNREKEKFRQRRIAEARKRIRKGEAKDAVISALSHPLYREEELQYVVGNELDRLQQEKEEQGPEGYDAFKLGLIMVAAGVALGFIFSGRIFVGLIVVGAYYIYKGRK